jgi:hypothetical protein
VTGGFASGGEGNTGDVNVGSGLVETWEDAFADLAGVVDGAFGEEDNDLTEFGVGTLGDEEGG